MTVSIFLQDRTITEEIYEDSAYFVIPDIIKEYWIGTFIDEKIIGLYQIQARGAILHEIHARILPQYRKKYSLKSSQYVVRWAFDMIPNINVLMAYVPTAHTNVAKHAQDVGFQYCGVIRNSYMKNGKMCDQEIYSLTKEDIVGVNHASGSSNGSSNNRRGGNSE